jgi:hypothetical protein
VLPAAGDTFLDQPLLVAVGAVVAAAGAAEAQGPARPDQVRPALAVGAEAPDEARRIARQIPQQLLGDHALGLAFSLRSLSPHRPPESSRLRLVESHSIRFVYLMRYGDSSTYII